jgi:hypothetical protein
MYMAWNGFFETSMLPAMAWPETTIICWHAELLDPFSVLGVTVIGISGSLMALTVAYYNPNPDNLNLTGLQ